MDDELADAVWKVDFSVSKSMRYHAYARSIWDFLDHWNKVLILVTGMAIVVAYLKKVEWLEAWVAFGIGVLAVFDIVFGFSDHARAHDGLYRQFCRLAQDIARTVEPSKEDLATWRARRLAIETEEPGIWEWLNRKCYREEAKSRGISSEDIERHLNA